MPEIHQVTYGVNLIQSFPCLYGLAKNTLCTYDPRSAPVNFSVGEAVATLGIVFAAIQLSDQRWKTTLLIKEWYLRNMVWILSIVGLCAVLMASSLSQLPNLSPPFGYPIFWEQIGFIAFAVAPLFYIVTATRQNSLFNKRRAERFYHILLMRVSTGNQKDIELVISLVWNNIEKLTDAIQQSESSSIEDTDDAQYQEYAKSLLNLLLSEKTVADYIVTYRIGFLFDLMEQIKEKRLSQRSLGMGFQKLVKRLFENSDSYLYKQLDYQGVTLYAPIYDVLFGDSYFIQHFSVLGMWNSYGAGVTDEIRLKEEYIKVFIKALMTAIKMNNFQNDSVSQIISQSLYDIERYTQQLVYDYKESKKASLGKILMDIEGFFGRNFLQAYTHAYDSNNVSEVEKLAQKDKRYRQCLTATYAECLVKFLGHIATMDDRELERHRTMFSVEELLPIHNDSGIYDNIRVCFFEYLWEQIKVNVERGHFPATLRVYISDMYWNDPTMPEWRKTERKKLVAYLYSELVPRMLKNELMANYKDKKESELLPIEITFNKKTKKIFIHYHGGSTEEFK